jgi:hypothetical protein
MIRCRFLPYSLARARILKELELAFFQYSHFFAMAVSGPVSSCFFCVVIDLTPLLSVGIFV